MWCVYLLLCSDSGAYVGCTNDLKDRILRLKAGKVNATVQRLPVKLHAYFSFRQEKVAFRFEKYLKTGNGRVFLTKHVFGNKKHKKINS